MNGRILRIETRRSLAPWAGLGIAASTVAFLFLLGGDAAEDSSAWTAEWTSMAMWTRGVLFYAWPLALGAGALQGLRDSRSKMPELLSSTPRPAWHRAASLGGTTAVVLASAFAVLVLIGGVQVLAHTEYTHVGWMPVSLVGALFLAAGAVLGIGIGRSLPSVFTPPMVTMAAFMLGQLLLIKSAPLASAVSTWEEARGAGLLPGRIALLAPAIRETGETLFTLSAAVHAGQLVWVIALTTTGFALLAAASRRGRLLALVPAVVGAAVALLILPSTSEETYVLDKAAAEKVCDGAVCVTAMQRSRLAGLTGPGEKALGLMKGALGGRAPVGIRERTTIVPYLEVKERSREDVLIDFDDEVLRYARTDEDLTRALLGLGLAPECSFGGLDVQSVASSWVMGEFRMLPSAPGPAAEMAEKTARSAWKRLTALPEAEQRERIDAMRASAFSCEDETDPLDVLAGGPR
ncbi:hypothetical protein CU044_2782 [Streptomyces sp. L-9-10]|uniref:hypothetical protein n=1 Tax=Streptomyces sp. L-9-10 TaxID=1478131 RepID=UPI00101BF54B|nr:hypothetical protein [Streptomyces sp. L-9-10]RYJ28365.1 hypothetical protein CU044_2782 [Streptomyces sp. L-9-10]